MGKALFAIGAVALVVAACGGSNSADSNDPSASINPSEAIEDVVLMPQEDISFKVVGKGSQDVDDGDFIVSKYVSKDGGEGYAIVEGTAAGSWTAGLFTQSPVLLAVTPSVGTTQTILLADKAAFGLLHKTDKYQAALDSLKITRTYDKTWGWVLGVDGNFVATNWFIDSVDFTGKLQNIMGNVAYPSSKYMTINFRAKLTDMAPEPYVVNYDSVDFNNLIFQLPAPTPIPATQLVLDKKDGTTWDYQLLGGKVTNDAPWDQTGNPIQTGAIAQINAKDEISGSFEFNTYTIAPSAGGDELSLTGTLDISTFAAPDAKATVELSGVQNGKLIVFTGKITKVACEQSYQCDKLSGTGTISNLVVETP